MQVFKTDRKTYLANELKSWLWAVVFTLLLYFGCKMFLAVTLDKLFIGIVVIFLLKIGNTLTQNHVAAIQVDKQNNQLTFVLYSRMSGQKVKKYELAQVRSSLLQQRSGPTSIFFSPVTLKILLSPKDMFIINGRYGFSAKTLAAIDQAIKSSFAPDRVI